MSSKVILLHRDPARGSELVNAVAGGDIECMAATNVRDAISKLAQERPDMMVVDAALSGPSAIEFLAKAREKAPRVLRALLADPDVEVNLEAAVNEAGACAIVRPPLDPAQLRALLAEYARPVQQAPAQIAPVDKREIEKLTKKVQDLELKLKKSERDLRIARNADSILKEEELELETLRKEKERSALGAEIDIDYMAEDLDKELSKAFDHMLKSPNVTLPAMPQVALELQKMMRDPDVEFDKVAEVVSVEAAISTRVLSICNSPVYAGVEPIRNVNQAVARLGVETMRDIVATAATENLFQSDLKAMNDLMSKLWFHSLFVAHANTMVAEALQIEERDDFFTMGLLHDIGKLAIATMINQGFENGLWNKKIMTPKRALALVQERHLDIGETAP